MKKNWWILLLAVLIIGTTGVMLMGIRTYQDAPPIPDFVSKDGETIISKSSIQQGQIVFQKYALMNYGSMFGDGAGRGPDFTADALHRTAQAMKEYYFARESVSADDEMRVAAIEARVKKEIKQNNYDPRADAATLSQAQAHAYGQLVDYYASVFNGSHSESFHPTDYITDADELKSLASFFYWGGWVCGAQRPGNDYSYTHNWPYDESAGNLPTSSILFWSVFGVLGLILGLGLVLYFYGRFDKVFGFQAGERASNVVTGEGINRWQPSAGQRATYKFFIAAVLLLLAQTLAGILTIHDFVRFTTFFGVDISAWLPVTITRTWHVQTALLWISSCWIGASIYLLPTISGQEPRSQPALINLLFGLIVLVTAGSLTGEFLGPKGRLGEWWHLLGNQGWEFVELGKLWQWLLFAAFGLWALIVYRGIKPALRGRETWSLPYWLVYAIVSILLFFCAGFVAGPTTNFAVADFWRWMTIHMWVEAFFEVFTTVIVAYFMYQMGLATQQGAARTVYFATLLFLGSGILGVSHNFYWNAKPVITLSIGSVFSTLQAVPLIVLTLEAWKLRRMPVEALRLQSRESGWQSRFGQSEAFLFLLAVNFWNFFGAGVLGFIINLPIVNYYEHGTYLTVNHGHAALMGVYGNLAIAAMLFCSRYLISASLWNAGLLRCVFWSVNIGLSLMVLLDLFPAGALQLMATLDNGLWYSRSQEFINGIGFQTLTWMRAVGGSIFVVGGVLPIAWFILSRARAIKTRDAAPVEVATQAEAVA